MVTIIKTGHSIHRIFNYNENKVKEGIAECIGAENYPINADKISSKMKLNRLLKQAALNENVKRNSVHISLNFDSSDKNLSKEKLMEIAKVYIEKIGFGEQPYLVYQHFDAGHPHIHLVSIKIRADGSRIDTQNIGRNQSEKARKEIEKSFGLVVADERKRRQAFQLKPIDPRKIIYGQTETKRAITVVLDAVLEKYHYTSLPELNAVLGLYNVRAERGGESSRMYQHQGLLYQVLDDQHNSVGVPIKASLFYNKPTLKFLEGQFEKNNTDKQKHVTHIKNIIDLFFLNRKGAHLNELIQCIKQEGIDTVIRQNKEGFIYGITFIDHRTKCVFNGSALGRQYSAKGLQERLLTEKVFEPKSLTPSAQKQIIGLQPQATAAAVETKAFRHDLEDAPTSKGTEKLTLLNIITEPEYTSGYLPYQLKRNRKKEKKKKLFKVNNG